MNIAIFASSFWPHIGGVEELCRQLAQAYSLLGTRAIVITNQWPPDLRIEEEYEGIPVYRFPMRTPEGGWKVHVKYTATHWLVLRRMFKVLRAHRIDLVHVHCVSANGFYGLLAKRCLKMPLVVTAHGERTMDASGLYQRSVFMNRLLGDLLVEADWITACSKNTLEDLREYGGLRFGGRSSVVYGGIRLTDFDASDLYRHRRPYVLGIGRLVPQKGFDVLVRAFVESALASHDLLIAGEGPESRRLTDLVAELGLEERVHLLGRADRPKAVALFKGCELFVLPSRLEPMGIVNLEAMAAAKPVVATRVGGVPEVVQDGVSGILVPPEDVGALAEAIRALLGDPVRRRRLGAAGRERVKAFDWPAIAEQYFAIYGLLLGRGSAAD